MRTSTTVWSSTLVLALASAAWGQHGCGMGSGGHDHESASTHEHGSKADAPKPSNAAYLTHGGCAAATKAHHFEVVYLEDGIRVYAFGADQEPISAAGIQGRIVVSPKNGSADTLALAYRPAQPLDEASDYELRDHLFAEVDLAEAKPESFRAKVALSKLPGDGEPQATFVQTFPGVSMRPFMCPMHPDVWGESPQSKCPLCGMKTADRRPAAPGAREEEPQPAHGVGHEHGR